MERLLLLARQYPLASALVLGGALMIIIAVIWALIAQPF
jgi:hypothetical protein